MPPFAVKVDGFLLPTRLSGHPALELCNTVARWDEPPEHRKEWLTTPAHLATWAVFAGLAEQRPPVDDAVLAEVRELRAVAYRLLRHRDESAFPTLVRYADDANARTTLTRTDGAVGFVLKPSDDPRRTLHAAALAVVDLLGSPGRDTVRACPGEGCGWLFLDPRGRRTWCLMAVCGNRAKVRAHAARKRTGPG